MHSSSDAACKCTSLQPSERANQFSFPPTQRFGLLAPTAIPSAYPLSAGSNTNRSPNQRVNLQRAFENLLASLTIALPKKTPA